MPVAPKTWWSIGQPLSSRRRPRPGGCGAWRSRLQPCTAKSEGPAPSKYVEVRSWISRATSSAKRSRKPANSSSSMRVFLSIHSSSVRYQRCRQADRAVNARAVSTAERSGAPGGRRRTQSSPRRARPCSLGGSHSLLPPIARSRSGNGWPLRRRGVVAGMRMASWYGVMTKRSRYPRRSPARGLLGLQAARVGRVASPVGSPPSRRTRASRWAKILATALATTRSLACQCTQYDSTRRMHRR